MSLPGPAPEVSSCGSNLRIGEGEASLRLAAGPGGSIGDAQTPRWPHTHEHEHTPHTPRCSSSFWARSRCSVHLDSSSHGRGRCRDPKTSGLRLSWLGWDASVVTIWSQFPLFELFPQWSSPCRVGLFPEDVCSAHSYPLKSCKFLLFLKLYSLPPPKKVS